MLTCCGKGRGRGKSQKWKYQRPGVSKLENALNLSIIFNTCQNSYQQWVCTCRYQPKSLSVPVKKSFSSIMKEEPVTSVSWMVSLVPQKNRLFPNALQIKTRLRKVKHSFNSRNAGRGCIRHFWNTYCRWKYVDAQNVVCIKNVKKGNRCVKRWPFPRLS